MITASTMRAKSNGINARREARLEACAREDIETFVFRRLERDVIKGEFCSVFSLYKVVTCDTKPEYFKKIMEELGYTVTIHDNFIVTVSW